MEDIQVLTPVLTHFFGLAAQCSNIKADDGRIFCRISPEVGNIQHLIRICFDHNYMVQEAIYAAISLMGLMAYTDFGESSFLELIVDQARCFGDIPLLAECNVSVGDVLRNRFKCTTDHAYVEALYAEALVIFKQRGNDSQYASCLLKMGEVGMLTNRLDQAELQITEALAIFTQIDDQAGRAGAQRCLGDVAMDNGDNFLADQCYKAALELHESIGGD
jgi:hypothetical protein